MQVIIKYTKHPQKWPTKNFTKRPPKIFDHLCENYKNPIRTFFQSIPQKWPTKNSTKQPSKIFDHLCENYKNPIQTFFQNIPQKWPTKNSTKQPSKIFDHLLHFFGENTNHSIMVRMIWYPPKHTTP